MNKEILGELSTEPSHLTSCSDERAVTERAGGGRSETGVAMAMAMVTVTAVVRVMQMDWVVTLGLPKTALMAGGSRGQLKRIPTLTNPNTHRQCYMSSDCQKDKASGITIQSEYTDTIWEYLEYR